MIAEIAKFGGHKWHEAVELRRRVLRHPLGMDFSDEELRAESEQLHLVLWEDRVWACALLVRVDDSHYKVRQVAVDASRRGQGLGRQIMGFAERLVHMHGGEEIALHARESSVPFYLALGYQVEGEPFTEIGLPHRKMVRSMVGYRPGATSPAP